MIKVSKQKIAVITARGGSKRIPWKNIKGFCGKPIIAYSIEAAISSNIFSEIMVSTDSEKIAEVAKQYGANVPFMRSSMTSDDYATTSDVLMEVLLEYREQGRFFDNLCCIYPTAPFVTAERLKEAMELLEEDGVDSVLPVTAFSYPPMRGVYVRDGFATYSYPEYATARSQDIETMYHDCGQFYCLKVESFLKTKKMVTNKTKAIIISESEVQDIDTLEDWKMAELKYKLKKEI